jgi:hypothetical protein
MRRGFVRWVVAEQIDSVQLELRVNRGRGNIGLNIYSADKFLVWFEVLTAVVMKSSAFWSIMPCSLKPATCLTLVSCLTQSSTLKMEATCSFKTFADFQRTIKRYIPEDVTLQISCTHSIPNSVQILSRISELKQEDELLRCAFTSWKEGTKIKAGLLKSGSLHEQSHHYVIRRVSVFVSAVDIFRRPERGVDRVNLIYFS